MNREIAYMVDTNVLYDWLFSYIPQVKLADPHYNESGKEWRTKKFIKQVNRVKQFMELNENTIYIPDMVWSEFLGVTLHKDMDVSGNLNQLKLKFKLLLGVVQQLEAEIHKNPRLQFFSAQSEKFNSSPFADAAELATDIDLFDQDLFDILKSKAKFLDGMDAAIVYYLNNLAANHPEQRIMLYTGDKPMFKGFERIRNHWKCNDFSQNTGAVCSNNGTIQTCSRIDPPSDVLRKAAVRNLGLL